MNGERRTVLLRSSRLRSRRHDANAVGRVKINFENLSRFEQFQGFANAVSVDEIHFQNEVRGQYLNGKTLSFRDHMHFCDIIIKDDFIIIGVNEGITPPDREFFSRIFSSRQARHIGKVSAIIDISSGQGVMVA